MPLRIGMQTCTASSLSSAFSRGVFQAALGKGSSVSGPGKTDRRCAVYWKAAYPIDARLPDAGGTGSVPLLYHSK